MDCCSQPGLLSVHDALLHMHQQLIPVQETEWVDLALALDRILAESVLANINVPASDNSAMDGYALRTCDAQTEGAVFDVIGQSLAGHPFRFAEREGAQPALGKMQVVRIMTGAMIPAGADAVVMQENVTRTAQTLHLNKLVVQGENIRRAGDDIKKDSEVLSKGHRISALDIGLLASLGIARIKVWRKLRIAVLSTGDELLSLGSAHDEDKIYDSNRPLLCAFLQRLNVEIKDIGIIADDLLALRAAFMHAAQWADVVISTGGVSVGDADYTKTILEELGQIDFWKVAMKPGKPFAFGRLGAGWFLGLPGNPVSTAVTYHQLVVPALRYLAREKWVESLKLSAIAQQSFKKHSGRMDFQRGILASEQGVNTVVSAGSQSSGVLSSMAKANGYICLEAERGTVLPGETVTVIPFDRFIR